VWAQADAQAAFQKARAAFDAGKYDSARDLLISASQTDKNNPEVSLWLGKAHYQLGEIDRAMAAWKRTLQLAPDQAYAGRMLKVLRGHTAEMDVRIKLIETLMQENLPSEALKETESLLANKALTDPQRAKVTILKAELLIRAARPKDVPQLIHALRATDPENADPAMTTLLLGEAKLCGGSDEHAEALAMLKKVVAEHQGTPAAVSARLALIEHNLRLGIDAAKAKGLADWIDANPEHWRANKTRRTLISVYLSLTGLAPAPKEDAPLAETDKAALAVLADLDEGPGTTLTPVGSLLEHFDQHYRQRGAHGAAIAGLTALTKLRLSPDDRLKALQSLADNQAELAIRELTRQAKAGDLADGPSPDSLKAVLATYATINQELPTRFPWDRQAALAVRVQGLSALLPAAAHETQLKPPLQWAVEIALTVVKGDANIEAIDSALKTIDAVIDESLKLKRKDAAEVALAINAQLLKALESSRAQRNALASAVRASGQMTKHQHEMLFRVNNSWQEAMLRKAELLGRVALARFNDNRKEGKDAENAKLSGVQQELLATLAGVVERRAGASNAVVQRLGDHLQPWIKHGHYLVAEQAYTSLGPKLAEPQRRQMDLAVVHLWSQEVHREHRRLTAAGLTIPRKLNPTLAKALERMYELHSGVEDADPFLSQVRSSWKEVIDHYRRLEYFDIAEEAIKTAPEKKVDQAASYAELQLAHLRYELAGRELKRLMEQYKGRTQISITPAFQAAIDAYSQIVANRPTSPLATEAVNGVFNVAQLFERHHAYQPAAKVYGDFAALAANIPPLVQAEPGAASIQQRAAFAVALAMDAQAHRELNERMSRRKPDSEPPAQISDEFATAIASYQKFVNDHPKSTLVAQANDKVMSIALAYVNIGAWKVADTIYSGQLEARVAMRRPERLKFCRAMCYLGPAMPAHAKEVLTVLASRRGGAADETDVEAAGELLARRQPPPAQAAPPATEPDQGAASATRGAGRPDSRPADAQPQVAVTITDQITAGGTFQVMPDRDLAQRDAAVSNAIREQQAQRATQIAMLRDQFAYRAVANKVPAQQGQQSAEQQIDVQAPIAVPVLSDAEIARLTKAFDAAYQAFIAIEKEHPHTATARQARGETLVMVGHWRSLSRWQESAELAERFLADHPTDAELPKIRLEIARDLLSYASQPVKTQPSKQAMLAEVAKRFQQAREALEKIIADFPDDIGYVQKAQWDIANSYLTRARVVSAFSNTLARGQYVRAARQLQHVADEYEDHPQIGQIPQMQWNIAQELSSRRFFDEAIIVWTDLTVRYPTHALAQQAARQVAQTYQSQLDRPLKAVEIYQELNFGLGGNNVELQDAIYNIGVKLKNDRRWVEALHILETFVDTFPRHPNAGQTLTMIGQIHQANEAWEDAIAAYKRAITEYNAGEFVKSAKWSIAECTINLSRWQEAIDAYREYIKAYPDDEQAKTATARIDIIKDLASYQAFVDEEGQRKADDAQFQIARIVHEQLANPVKAIIEYRKVKQHWPKSHLADDALYRVGTSYLSLDETEKAREALQVVAAEYPASPLADDALFLVGKSHEDESQKLATVTRAQSLQMAKEVAQRKAYSLSQLGRRRIRDWQQERVSKLKKAGKQQLAENEEAFYAAQKGQFDQANVTLFARQASQEVETLTAAQLADRQDKINAALRKAINAYRAASTVAAGDKADEALLRMAEIFDERLKDSDAAIATWLEIVRQFSGTAVAEDASWRIAQYYERTKEHAKAIDAYDAFLRNYRRSPNAGPAQEAIAENYEKLGEWIKAMDAYSNYLNNYPDGPFAKKAKDRINWIKTYRL